ncbi:hypothetical protein NUACC26_050070 [Scytonema sp. NUACC26]
MKYTILIQWSDEDRCYIVLLPEFKNVMQLLLLTRARDPINTAIPF